jgi:uncharacterized membrane protein
VDTLVDALMFAGAMGCGVVGGVFFAFSTFVMRGLARAGRQAGMASMQAINVTVINPWFMTPFLGTALACVVLITAGLTGSSAAQSLYVLSGSCLYLCGSILVTFARNVPLNNLLAATQATSANARTTWNEYVLRWTRWNTVRVLSSLGASSMFIAALVRS